MHVKKLHHAFPTRRTVLMDLQYNKRNLLLSVGKYTGGTNWRLNRVREVFRQN